MLKRSRDIARAAGEAVGVIAPKIADAETSAEHRRQDLVAAQAAVASAESELERLYDVGASPKDLSEAEARIADAKLTAERAQRHYAASEKRLTVVRTADAAKAKAAARGERDEAIRARKQAAAEMDRLADLAAEQGRIYDAQADALSIAASAGVAARSMYTSAATLIQLALERAGAVPSTWLGDKREQPGAVELADRDAGSILSGDTA